MLWGDSSASPVSIISRSVLKYVDLYKDLFSLQVIYENTSTTDTFEILSTDFLWQTPTSHYQRPCGSAELVPTLARDQGAHPLGHSGNLQRIKVIEFLLDQDFQSREVWLAVVIDEWGSFEGIVTIEDILEEIVGEIRNEFDEEEPSVREREDGSYEVDGRIPIGVVNDALGSRFESEDFDTMGGLVLSALGRAPEVGDEVTLDGYVLRVEEIDGPRVAQLVVRSRGEGDADNGSHSGLREG